MMSASIHSLNRKADPPPSLHPVTLGAFAEFRASVNSIKAEIGEAETVAEAFQMYQWLAALASEMNVVVDVCAARCEELMRRL